MVSIVRVFLVIAFLSHVVSVVAAPNSAFPVSDAVRAGQIEDLRSLLIDGADVNLADGSGMTALHWAAQRSNESILEMLLYAGGNINAKTRLGAYTPLILASKSGHGVIVERLLEAGADVNDSTATGVSPLMFASEAGDSQIVKLLLERGAEVNGRESTGGHTALMFAAASNNSDVIRTLIDNGAEFSLVTEVIDIPTLNEALLKGFQDRLKDLSAKQAEAVAAAGGTVAVSEEKQEPEKTSEKKRNIFARLFGWLKRGNKKEEEKPQSNRRRREPFGERVGKQGGMTALLLAARNGHKTSVEVLLDAGADINQVADGSKTSPLLIATMNGHFDLAKFLLDHGADPNLAAEPSNVTPLYATINLAWAPRSAYPHPTSQKQQRIDHLELMEEFLLKGAEPNARLSKKVWFMGFNFDRTSIDEVGATPFWRAAYGSDVPAMRLLRSYGADVNIPTSNLGGRAPENQTPQPDKDLSGSPTVPLGGPAMTPLHGATGAGFGEGFAGNDYRNHPAGFMPAVRYLVEECGADVNARDHEGGTPLHNAAARGDVEMIKYLVSKGADPTFLNRDGQSTADMANGPVQRTQPFPEARDLLVQLGAINHNKCLTC